MPGVGSPLAATESRRVDEPAQQQQPAMLATTQGPFLPGVEPFRWLREYPPGMFDGLLRRRASRR